MSRILQVESFAAGLSLRDGGVLEPLLRRVMRDWRMVESETVEPVIDVERTDRGFRRRSPWTDGERRFRDPVDALCDLTVDLIHAHAAERPDWLCLHAAALQFGDGLVLFPNTYRAGKSTLAVRLAQAGARLYSDDVLPLDAEGQGVAMGVLPRLRMPLPETADPAFRDYVERRRGPHNARYHYIDPGEALARRGERLPVVGVVLLDRSEGAEARLEPADAGRVLREAILRNFAKGLSALELLDRLERLVRDADCMTLHYSDLEAASERLIERFGLPGRVGERRAGHAG